MSDESEARYQKLLPYYERLVRFIRDLGFSVDDARDLTQDVFLRVYEHVDRYLGVSRWGYLQQVARRLAYNSIRDKKAGKRHAMMAPEEELKDVADGRSIPADVQVAHNERARTLHHAIEQLPETQRICVVYFYLAGLTYDEIQTTLDITEPALKSRLNAARKRLKELLGSEWEGWEDES
jgi:RNA polymerase sigma-70 factor (ECF subfamily)